MRSGIALSSISEDDQIRYMRPRFLPADCLFNRCPWLAPICSASRWVRLSDRSGQDLSRLASGAGRQRHIRQNCARSSGSRRDASLRSRSANMRGRNEWAIYRSAPPVSISGMDPSVKVRSDHRPLEADLVYGLIFWLTLDSPSHEPQPSLEIVTIGSVREVPLSA